MKILKAAGAPYARILLLLAPAVLVSAQEASRPSVIAINEQQPLYRAATELERAYSVPISYEDAEYSSNDDLDRSRYVLPIPRAGILNFDLRPSQMNLETLLQELLEQHARNGNPGQFKLIKTADGFAIIPVAVKDETGAMVPYRPLLDAVISFPEADRSADATLDLICRLAGSASKKHIGLGGGPGALKRMRVRLGADHEVARDVIQRMLASVYVEGPESVPPTNASTQQFKFAWDLFSYNQPGYEAAVFVHAVIAAR